MEPTIFKGERRGSGFAPVLEAQYAASGAGRYAQALAGEDPRTLAWMQDRRPLVERAAKGEGLDLPASAPGAVFARRLFERMQAEGGYSKIGGSLKFLVEMVEREMLWELPLKRTRQLFAEALGAGTFDSILLDAQYKRLQKGFQLRTPKWMQVLSFRKDVQDFKTQNTIQVGSMPVFNQVPAQSPYPAVQFSDDRATYAVAKYGAMYGVSFEAMTNDDLQVLGRLAEKFGVGFGQTLDEFVFGSLIDDNPTIYDGVVLFHNGSHANDLGASKPLNDTNLEAAVRKLRTQTDPDGEPMELEPWALVVHPDETLVGERLIYSDKRAETADNDLNVWRREGRFAGGVITTARVTSGRWYVMADPRMAETIEMGALGGRWEPEMFEEDPLAGRYFEHEEKRWKSRMIFSGANVDWRWIVRANA